MLEMKRHKMRDSMTLAGLSQVLIVVVFTLIGADIGGWGWAAGAFALSYLLMGFQTIGMWMTSNLVRCMVKAGKLVNERPIYWLYSWPVFVWRAWRFTMTNDYVPDF